MKTLISSLILFLAILTSAPAQYLSLGISGNVTEINTGAPIPDHAVLLK